MRWLPAAFAGAFFGLLILAASCGSVEDAETTALTIPRVAVGVPVERQR